jgi:hypothetical protein
MNITSKDLVFLTQNNEVISGGFKINSNFLNEQIQKGGGIEKSYVVPAGLLYNNVKNIHKNLNVKESSAINNDLYDKLFDLVIYKKKKKTINNNKQHQKRKTKRQER